LEADLARVPDQDRIAAAQQRLLAKQSEHAAALQKLEEVKVRKKALRSQCERAEQQLERVGSQEVEARFSEDARQRMLKHSAKVRGTLGEFKIRVIRKHSRKIEALMLESFQALLRKQGLVSGLTIDPETFAVTLLDRSGQPLPFDRLSAGERQLLANDALAPRQQRLRAPLRRHLGELGDLANARRNHLDRGLVEGE
jgi:DNA sulfur modification protein DndD